MTLQAIKYRRGNLEILDQLRLPNEEIYVEIKNPQDGWSAIKSMQVRGAPAIAIVAALSLAVYLANEPTVDITDVNAASSYLISQSLKFLTTSRPTAVNLLAAARKLERVASSAETTSNSTQASVFEAYIEAAEDMLRHDVEDNQNIGKHGAEWIEEHCRDVADAGTVSVITHCNTGSLATAGYGTAFGVIRSLHSRGSLHRAFYTETRPYNQGARLTGFELIHDEIPAELITDSMAGLLLSKRKQPERITCVVVGADRVAANGDTANKIGTYTLAILARYHRIKFLVAAPLTTIDLDTRSGTDIVIEERSMQEVTCVKGPEIVTSTDGQFEYGGVKEISIAASGTKAWNPAFDITPAKLIDGIITEKGVVEPGSNGHFDLHELFDGQAEDKKLDDVVTETSNGVTDQISWDEVLRMKSDHVSPWRNWLTGVQ